jgi:hypothetical protein
MTTATHTPSAELAEFGLHTVTAPGLIAHAGKAVQIYTRDRLALVDPLAEPQHVAEAVSQLRERVEAKQALTAAHAPSWATDVDVCDEGQPGEYTTYSAEFGRQSMLGVDSFARDEEIRVIGWEYTAEQGDLAANEPTLEVCRRSGEHETYSALRLSIDDARRLAALLASSADRMEARS